MTQILAKFSSVALGALSVQPALAESAWMLGAAGQYETGYYVGNHERYGGLPYISYESDRFDLSSTDGLAIHLYEHDEDGDFKAKVSALATLRMAPDFGDDPLFKGLKRDNAFETGILGKVEYQSLYFEGKILADLSGAYDGSETTVAVGVQHLLGFLFVDAKVGAVHRTAGLNNYLFGVSTAEASANLPAFEAENSIAGFASLTAYVPLSENILILGDVTYDDLGDMKNSPLVDREANTTYSLGLLYRF